MILKRLGAENFRLCEDAGCAFEPGVNVICGINAQGKTTLLEAAWLLTGQRSFRARSDKEMVRFGAESARLTALVEADGRDHDCELVLGQRRRFSVNGVKRAPLPLRAILFSPADLDLVRGGAAERRRFMDAAISQLRPAYAKALAEASRLYEHKTRILRDGDPAMMDVLEDFSLRYAAACSRLIYYRNAWCRRLAETAPEINAAIGGERLELSYKTVTGVDPEGKKPAEIYPALVEHWKAHREAEIASGSCLSGAHKDDIELSLDGLPARTYASQGQARTAALSLKLAERDISTLDTGEPPVMLLDDVLSELDARRQDFVLNSIAGGQVLITCCEDGGISARTGGKVLTVEAGRVFQNQNALPGGA